MKTIVTIKFDAGRIPGGADAILGPTKCGSDVAKRKEYKIENYFENRTGTDVEVTLDHSDERAPKVLALLALHEKTPWVDYEDIYTEQELQAAPLLDVVPWGHRLFAAGPYHGTKYDTSTACPKCGAGVRQTSTLIIANDDLRTIEKLRVAGSYRNEVILHDDDVERLLASKVTGALFWPASSKSKSGSPIELRRQQVFPQHIMPPMAPSSTINRKTVCKSCHRGGVTTDAAPTVRIAYRAEDLTDIQDFNVTQEYFGAVEDFQDDMAKGRWPTSALLVTPKVMNLLRGKTKKEQKYQGCDFIPTWIEDDKHEKPYLQT